MNAISQLLLAPNILLPFCTNAINASCKKVSQFVIGAGLGIITDLSDEVIISGAQRFHLFPNDKNSFWNEYSKDLKNIFEKAGCSETDFWKVMFGSGLIVAIAEELFFRFLIQDLILQKGLGNMVQVICPSLVSVIDGKTGTIFRVAITSALFGPLHLIGTNCRKVLILQSFSALIAGFQFGFIKESQLGLLGAIGAHMMDNALSIGSYYLRSN